MRTLLLFLLLVSNSYLFAQVGQSIGKVDFYKEALKLHIKSSRTLTLPFDTIYVLKNRHLESMDSIFEQVRIVVVDDEFVHKKTSSKKGFRIAVVDALCIKNDEAVVRVADFWITRKRKKYITTIMHETKVKITYDCDIGSVNLTVVE